MNSVDYSPTVAEKTPGEQDQRLRLLLRLIRQEVGLTQLQVAQTLGRPQSYVSKYESGERNLTFIEVEEVCDSLGISLSDFVYRFEGIIEG